MNFDILLPITLIVGVVYAIRVVVEARLRQHILAAGASAEVVASLLRDEQRRRHQSALRWGIVWSSVALGFAVIAWLGWKEFTPGLIAVLAGATGIGHMIFFWVSRRYRGD
jgi:hypothetical protein